MTQQSVQNYNVKKQAAQAELQTAEQVIANGDANVQQISAEKDKVDQALQALNSAKNDLRADKTELQNAYNTLTEQVSTEGKTPASIKSIKTLKLRFKIRLMQLKMKLNKF